MSTTAVEAPAARTAGEVLHGELTVPPAPDRIVVFAHGSGSSRHSPRNRSVAQTLAGAGLGTLLVDLLTAGEEAVDARTAGPRFDIDLLCARVTRIVDWLQMRPETAEAELGLFGASTGAAAALCAAAQRPQSVRGVVSRGGRPDLAGSEALAEVRAPVLLLVGGRDEEVLALNRQAAQHMHGTCQVDVIPGATHLFEEPGALDQVGARAAMWFQHTLPDNRADDSAG